MSRTIPVVTAGVPLAAVLLASFLPATAGAASCREELGAFERRLNESSLAAAAPDRYAELARAAEEVSELRDETLCMERVAELNADLDAESVPPGTTGRSAPAPREGDAPPSAPLLLEASPVDYGRDTSAGGNEEDEDDGQSH